MEIVKKIISRLSRKQVFIIAFSLLGLALVIYYLFALIGVSRGELALADLKKSFTLEKICHEDCGLWREAREKIVVSDLKKGEKKLINDILKDWKNTSVDLDYKKELVKISYLAYGAENMPDYFKEYLISANSDPSLEREIITQFKLASESKQIIIEALSNKITRATSTNEKIETLKTLGELNEDAEIDNYFLILASGEPLALRRQSVKNISAIREKSAYFTKTQLEKLKEIIMFAETDLPLRQDLVLLVGDYHLVYPSESEALWQEIYENESLDSISRMFSADNLNHLAETNLELPAVSPEEWANYYNQ